MRSKEKEFPQAGFQINVQSFTCFWMEPIRNNLKTKQEKEIFEYLIRASHGAKLLY